MASGSFPEEYISPKEKEKDWYGLEYSQGMYYTNNRYGPQLFYDDSEFAGLTEVAQGRQSVDDLRRIFGHFQNAGGGDDGSGSLAFIDPKVLNLAPKYINRAVAKMQRLKFDFTLSAVDPVSIDEQKNMESQVKAVYQLKDWFDKVKLDPQEYFPELDLASLPEYSDELLYQLYTNPKIQKVIDGELTIKLLHAVNDFDQKMREYAWDVVVYGRGHFHCYLDHNGVPRVDNVQVDKYIGSYVENESYDNQQYSGYFDIITITQFIREASNFMSKEKIEEIIRAFALKNSTERSFYINRTDEKFDGLDYIPVLRFYFKSQDDRKYVVRPNQYGNKIMLEKSFNYAPGEANPRFGENGDSEVVSNTYTSIYGGTWVVDSDTVYDYGRKEYPHLNLVEATLPVISFAPNMKQGRVVSFLSQILEVLFMANVAWNKIKEILAKGWMGVREIDFNELEGVAMGRGGKEWTPRQVYEFLLKTNVLIKRGAKNKFDQKYTGSAIDTNPSGLMLADYFSTYTMCIQTLEGMTGTTVAESVESKERVAATAIKQSQFSGDLDMEYLYNAYEQMYKKCSHQLLLLMQQAKRNKTKIQGFIPALGKGKTEFFEVPDSLAYCEYGIIAERQPTEIEWAGFYNDVSIAVSAGVQGLPGGISIADSALLRELDNLKQARQIMAIRQQIYERKTQKIKQEDQQMAIQTSLASAQHAAEVKANEIEMQKNADMEVEVLKGKIQEKLQNDKIMGEAAINGVTQMAKERIAKNTSVDSIRQQLVKNLPEQRKAEAAMIKATKPEPEKVK